MQQLLNVKRLAVNEDELARRAQIRNVYFAQDNLSIQYILKNQLSKFMDNYDISKLQYISLDDFTRTFLQKIALVHKSPMIVRYSENVDEETQGKIQSLFNEVEINKVLQNAEMRMKLHNTILIGVRYFDKLNKLYLDDSFDAGTCQVVGFDGYEDEQRFVIRKRMDRFEKPEWIVWQRDTDWNYRIVDEPRYDMGVEDLLNERYMIDGSGKFNFQSSYFPFVKYQAVDQYMGFWGNGFDALVQLVQTVNILLTVLSDDTISETLRILLMNFVPVGIDGKPGEFKVGMRNPVVAQLPPGEEANAEVLSAELYTEEILTFVDKLVDQLASMHGIDNVLTKEIKADITATAERLRNEPLIQTWQRDINVIRKYDLKLVNKLIEVNNFHREDNQIDPEVVKEIVLDYQIPNAVTNELEDYNLERLKWEDGTSSPLLWVMRRNPEMSKEEAENYIRENKQSTNELLGIGALPEVPPEEIEEIIG
jgi:hypothetical protein